MPESSAEVTIRAVRRGDATALAALSFYERRGYRTRGRILSRSGANSCGQGASG